MNHAMMILLCSALPVGFIHTLTGPDHYVPFIALAKARKWSMPKTMLITLLCGIGHVASALVLGLIAVAVGFTMKQLNIIESFRGEIATWLLIVLGLLYCIWGIRFAIKRKTSHHLFMKHNHHALPEKKSMMPWILFILFVLGPCEPLIPLIIYPAIKGNTLVVFGISTLFGIATIATMLFMVAASVYSSQFIKIKALERYGHAAAGAVIFSVGIVIKVFGL